MTAAVWNERHPVGTAVDYYPIAGDPEFVRTETRTPAWELGHGAAVVSVKGKTGGVLISHCRPLAAPAKGGA